MSRPWVLITLAILPLLTGCSYALRKAERLQEWRTGRQVEKAAEMAAAQPIKVAASVARDVALFTGTVTGPCRSLSVRADGATAGPELAAIREKVNAIYGSKTLSEAEQVAAEIQDLLPQVERAASPGVHGGCMLPVAVVGDPLDVAGQIVPRKVLCPVGETEQRCLALPPMSAVSFEGRVVGAAYYVPNGPEGLR